MKPKTDWEECLDEAESALKKNDFNTALLKAQDALTRTERFEIRVYKVLGEVHSKQGKNDLAESFFLLANDRMPQIMRDVVQLVKSLISEEKHYEQKGDSERAIRHHNEAVYAARNFVRIMGYHFLEQEGIDESYWNDTI